MGRLTPDEKLLESETPQDQVDRMGNGWKLQAQYEKQLELPVHAVNEEVGMVSFSDGRRAMGYTTLCGLVLGDVTLRSASEVEDVTCEACLA